MSVFGDNCLRHLGLQIIWAFLQLLRFSQPIATHGDCKHVSKQADSQNNQNCCFGHQPIGVRSGISLALSVVVVILVVCRTCHWISRWVCCGGVCRGLAGVAGHYCRRIRVQLAIALHDAYSDHVCSVFYHVSCANGQHCSRVVIVEVWGTPTPVQTSRAIQVRQPSIGDSITGQSASVCWAGMRICWNDTLTNSPARIVGDSRLLEKLSIWQEELLCEHWSLRENNS